MITIPTIAELYDDVKGDIETKFGDNIPAFGKSFLRAMAIVQAGKLWIYYKAIASLQRNVFPDAADPEANGGSLERFGRVKLGRNPFPATAGQYAIQITGTVGAIVSTGTVFRSNDDSVNPGKLFIVDADFELLTDPDVLIVRALEAGEDSQMDIGEGMTATIPIANVDKAAIVAGEEVEPLEAEDIEDYREKVLNAFRTEPNGGSSADYRLWASDAQGVQRVYPYARTGYTAEINLYVEATVADSTDGKGTPTNAILTEVEEVIEFDPDTTKPLNERGRRPLGTFQINYLPISVKEISVVVNNFVGLTAEVQANIEAAVEEAINEIRPFVSGADVLEEKNDILDMNKIIATIITANPGSVFGEVELTIDGTPFTSNTFVNGDIPHLDSITFP